MKNKYISIFILISIFSGVGYFVQNLNSFKNVTRLQTNLLSSNEINNEEKNEETSSLKSIRHGGPIKSQIINKGEIKKKEPKKEIIKVAEQTTIKKNEPEINQSKENPNLKPVQENSDLAVREKNNEEIVFSQAEELNFLNHLKNLSINVEIENTDTKTLELKSALKTIKEVFELIPAKHTKSLKKLKLYAEVKGKRGLSGGSTMILRVNDIDSIEFKSVLIHEIGHLVDLGMLRGNQWSSVSNFEDGSYPIWEDDPSVEFYNLSWDNNETKKSTIKENDFISGYATTNPFEDFAESYLAYVLHSEDFRVLANFNPILRKKYEWIRDNIFEGEEFVSQRSKIGIRERVWDMTLVANNQKI